MDKKKRIVVSSLAAIMTLSSVGMAAQQARLRKLNGVTGGMTYKINGKDITSQIERTYGTPGVVLSGDEFGEGRSYFPARAMELMEGIEVDYDHPTRTVSLTNKSEERFTKILKSKDDEIEKLKKENKKLQEKIDQKEDVEVAKEDLKELEKDLNRLYGDYDKVKFDIKLKESKNKITVDIQTDLGDYMNENYWYRFTTTDKKDLIESIVGRVGKDFKNNDIDGQIYDIYSRRDLMTFSKEGGKTIKYGSSGSGSYGTIDETLAMEFSRYGVKGPIIDRFDIKRDMITLDVFVVNRYDIQNLEKMDYKDIEHVLDITSGELEREYAEYFNVDVAIYVEDYGQRPAKIGSYIKNKNTGSGVYTPVKK